MFTKGQRVRLVNYHGINDEVEIDTGRVTGYFCFAVTRKYWEPGTLLFFGTNFLHPLDDSGDFVMDEL